MRTGQKGQITDGRALLQLKQLNLSHRIPCNCQTGVDTNPIHEAAAMGMLTFLVKNALTTTFSCCKSAAVKIAKIFASVNTVEPWFIGKSIALRGSRQQFVGKVYEQRGYFLSGMCSTAINPTGKHASDAV